MHILRKEDAPIFFSSIYARWKIPKTHVCTTKKKKKKKKKNNNNNDINNNNTIYSYTNLWHMR